MKKIELPTYIVYILLLIFTIILPNTIFLNFKKSYSLIIKPLIWTGLFAISFIFNNRLLGIRKKDKTGIIKNVLIITLTYIIIYYSLGLIFGFLKTPYSHSVLAILENLFSIVYVIILQEYVRFFLTNKTKKNKLNFILITLTFVLINIDFSILVDNFKSLDLGFKYTCSTLLPLIVNNCLFTYFCTHSGFIPSTIYRTIIQLFFIVFPIVPDIDWFYQSILEIITAFITFFIVSYNVLDSNKVSKRTLKKQNPITVIPFVLVAILLICFVSGIFVVMPVAVMSNSMVPQFERGDIVIMSKLKNKDIDNLKVGDIILYKLNNQTIIHRIHSIVDSEKNIYITKGDNNEIVDPEQVNSNQIIGKVIFSIPKIGYPSVWFNMLLSN